jgi:DNA-binding ferritin-like protein
LSDTSASTRKLLSRRYRSPFKQDYPNDDDIPADEGTADMVTGRLKEHEKTAWMLRSLLR